MPVLKCRPTYSPPQELKVTYRLPTICPPLLNSATPWATTLSDLHVLYASPYTGAITTRTSLLKKEFSHDDAKHRFVFFDVVEGCCASSAAAGGGELVTSKEEEEGNREGDSEERGRGEREKMRAGKGGSSLNTLGYSPLPFSAYLSMIRELWDGTDLETKKKREKPVIISVTGNVEEVMEMYRQVLLLSRTFRQRDRDRDETGRSILPTTLMELNLSCPNIPDQPPPAYDAVALAEYVNAMGQVKGQCLKDLCTGHGREREDELEGEEEFLPRIGIKIPPFTHKRQLEILVRALEEGGDGNVEAREEEKDTEGKSSRYPIDFITATNTLGNCLVPSSGGCETPTTTSTGGRGIGIGIGGLAGDALHPLALGNVKLLRETLDLSPYEGVRSVGIIGGGGVKDKAACERMRSVGAQWVGVGSAVGREGIAVFEDIINGVEGG